MNFLSLENYTVERILFFPLENYLCAKVRSSPWKDYSDFPHIFSLPPKSNNFKGGETEEPLSLNFLAL